MRRKTNTRESATSVDAQVLEAALALHDRDEAADREAHDREARRAAAVELGVEAAHVEAAEAHVAAARAEASRRRAARGRLLRGLAGLAAALGVLGGVAWIADAPAPPWTERFLDRDRWEVRASPGALALLRWGADARGRDVALVTVDHVPARTGDRAADVWWVDLEGQGLPDVGDHDALVLALAGTLPRAQVGLYAGPDERWVAPPVTLTPEWATVRLELDALEHQRLTHGRWVTVQSLLGGGPSDVDTVVVSVGQGVNPREARGVVRVGELRCE